MDQRKSDAFEQARWALLGGNFVIGCGVMVLAGTLNDLTRALHVSVPVAGQLISIAALVMGIGAPLLAGLLSRWDRRVLLTGAMIWYAVGHALCALAPNYAALLPLRALTVLSAAVFTPQAAATAGYLARPAQRGRAITFVFLGWTMASVLGMPLAAWIGERLGWRVAMGSVALAAGLAAWGVWRRVPSGVRPPALSWLSWRQALTQPVLMMVVAVTALQSAGQITVLAYAAPYFRRVLHATPEQVSIAFAWMGVCGLVGNIVLNRYVDRISAGRAVGIALACVALGQLLWPLATNIGVLMLVVTPWALGNFATNSAQQARLSGLSPNLAPALMALNTSAIYLGHAAGAASGGALIELFGFGLLHWVSLAWVVAAMLLSWVAWRRQHTVDIRHGQT